MARAPGNITVTPDARVLVSMHQFFPSDLAVAEVRPDGGVVPFPAPGRLQLDAVLGIQSDPQGVVWMLDNGRRSGVTPRLIGWDGRDDRLHREIPLPPPLTRETSMINDLAVDRTREVVYIADPARGPQAALIVVDLRSGQARRVLEGHRSVVAEGVELRVGGKTPRVRMPDGKLVSPRVGVNPIALDRDGEWLYFGPMSGTKLYRIATDQLRNPSLSASELAARVEEYAERPVSDGISMDHAGNIYITDIGNDSIGVLASDGSYRRWVTDPRLSWPDAFSYGPDGWLYLVANQLQNSAFLNAGEDIAEPPFYVMRVRPLAPGTIGR